MKTLKLNGTSLSTYGIYIASDTYLNAPGIDYTEYQIPAVDGNQIAYNRRLNNVVRKFDCFIKDNVDSGITSLKKLIYSNPGYMRIESDYDSSVYQMGYLAQEIEFNPFRDGDVLEVKFSLYFSCKPQKYSVTDSSVTISANTVISLNLRKVVTRNSQFCQELFDLLPTALIPENYSFFVFYTSSNTSSATNVTGINASWNGGSTFCACVVASAGNDHVYQVLSVSNQSISNASGTTTTAGRVAFVVPVQMSGIYSFSYNAGSAVSYSTADIGTLSKTVSNASAFGVKLASEDFYDVAENMIGSYYSNTFTMHGYFNGVKNSECTVELRTDLIDSVFFETLKTYSTYADGVYMFSVRIDYETNDVYLTRTGMPDVSMSAYFEIKSNMGEANIDEVKGLLYRNDVLSGAIITAKWWAL